MARAEFKALMCAAAPSPFGAALEHPVEYAWSTLIAPTAYPEYPRLTVEYPVVTMYLMCALAVRSKRQNRTR